MKYIFSSCAFLQRLQLDVIIAIRCDNCILDVNNGEKLSAEILLVDNDSLLVSVVDADKQVNIERIDVSSEKKTTYHLKITIMMVIGILVFGTWMRGWAFIKYIGYLSFSLVINNSKILSHHAGMSLSISELREIL